MFTQKILGTDTLNKEIYDREAYENNFFKIKQSFVFENSNRGFVSWQFVRNTIDCLLDELISKDAESSISLFFASLKRQAFIHHQAGDSEYS